MSSNETSLTTASLSGTGKRDVRLLRPTVVDNEDRKKGDVVSVEANVAADLIGSGMAEPAESHAGTSPRGQMFKTGEKTPHVTEVPTK